MREILQQGRPNDEGCSRPPPVERLLADCARHLFADQAGHVLLAVGGPGGTGKSTFAARLAGQLGDATVLTLDDYKTSREARQRAGLFGPHPDANRMALIARHLAALRRGEDIDKPVYDRATGIARQTVRFEPARWIIVDGEVSTYTCFRTLVDFSVFIDSDWRTQLATRLGRDLEARGYSPEKAVATFLHSNLREFPEHGAPSKQWADVHLFCQADYRLTLESIIHPIHARVRSLLPGYPAHSGPSQPAPGDAGDCVLQRGCL